MTYSSVHKLNLKSGASFTLERKVSAFVRKLHRRCFKIILNKKNYISLSVLLVNVIEIAFEANFVST